MSLILNVWVRESELTGDSVTDAIIDEDSEALAA